MSMTADTYYTCPKCGVANSKLMARQASGGYFSEPDLIYERVCLACWTRWMPGEVYPIPHWSDAKGVLADVRPACRPRSWCARCMKGRRAPPDTTAPPPHRGRRLALRVRACDTQGDLLAQVLSLCPEVFFVSPDSPEQSKSALDALPKKRQAFVRAFVTGEDEHGSNRFNATAAARAAGYADPRRYGSDLRTNPDIQAAISELLSTYTLPPDATLMLLREDALRSDSDVIRLASQAAEDAGVPAGASMVSALISSRTTARTNLAKHHGLLTDKVQFEGEFPVLRILRMGDEG